MQAKNVTLEQLVNAVTNSNINVGGGLLPVGEQQLVVRGVGLLQSVDDIKRIVVAVNNGVAVRVGDIGDVVVGHALRQGMFQYQNNPDAVEGVVLLKRGENASEVLDRVKEKVQEINTSILPPGIDIFPFYDRQVLLDITLETVKHTLFFGISLVLVLIILYIFLGNFKAAAVVAAVIPLALCVLFFNMDQFKVPANLISLGAIDFGVFGVIVDAAVIVMENVMRHLEERRTKLNQSIVLGTSEVQRAMVFSTGIIITAYSPLFLMGGVEGIIFRPMAFTMGFALLASIILSLTFVPTMISYIFKEGEEHHPPKFADKLLVRYKSLLRYLVDRPKNVLLTAIGVLIFTIVSATQLGTEFLSTLEENNLWVRVTLPNTVDLKYSVELAN